jgi:hypothetical protein
MSSSRDAFPYGFDQVVPVGEPGNLAFFGHDVLRGLVEGIDDYVSERQPRWKKGFRMLGPAMIACSPWLDDPDVLAALDKLTAVNIMTRKPKRNAPEWKLRPLRDVNERLNGLPVRALPGLGDMAPTEGGRPRVIGPYSQIHADDLCLPAIRTLGFRAPNDGPAPIAHAKLALLGRMWWHDEGALGHVEDVLGFTAHRLWVSSANFTKHSRRCLEFGYWTEDPALLRATDAFLVRLLGASEDLDAQADTLTPDLARVEFDDEAMAEALAEAMWDDEDDYGDDEP